MSALPSPLKSPAPTACQEEPGLDPARPPETNVVPFISQTATVPSSFCHRRSDLPSPLKSPATLICQADPGLVHTVPAPENAPLIIKTVVDLSRVLIYMQYVSSPL